ncbi:methylated-DNA--[protein]-cysteine S-methyltransferase [Corynebacterium breve]|uniref:Methylated-DNA--[protein]-cysteine S-methyltransferase n=1 Tax=Corynebacterium breve TaxID=3049799 RepID=A0ABY8VFL1_9CORY|nr:methylated-DNA--[protein]-cysteine S-methyltransferase [Corynebacterium breve]WIM68430.1 methylated-DNA--[protein]-cysteine S-methyltransferase [Corynebacterium breve]
MSSRVYSSPIGWLLLSSNAESLTQVDFIPAPPEVSDDHCPILDQASAWLDHYFAGHAVAFDVPLSLDNDTFSERAQHALALIPAGQTRSYTWLADQAGSPGAVRAAGTACARNPLPIFLPCHRIVRSDGVIGNYRGGTEAKKWLLDHERNLSDARAV